MAAGERDTMPLEMLTGEALVLLMGLGRGVVKAMGEEEDKLEGVSRTVWLVVAGTPLVGLTTRAPLKQEIKIKYKH